MNINKIEINDFRIYRGKKIFDFNNKKLIILYGPNGNGKSTLYDAIEWCLTGKIERYSSSKEKQFNYVVNNQAYDNKGYCASVKIIFDNNFYVERYETDSPSWNCRNYNKGVVFNGEDIRITNGNKKISSLLSGSNDEKGLEKFQTTVKKSLILSQDEISKFILVDDPKVRLATFENIMGLDLYGEKFKKHLEKDRKSINPIKTNLENEIMDIEYKLKIYTGDREKNILKLDNLNKIVKIQENVDEMDIINKYNKLINPDKEINYVSKDITENINNLKASLQDEVDCLIYNSKKVNDFINTYHSDTLNDLNKSYTSLKNNIIGLEKEVKSSIEIKKNNIDKIKVIKENIDLNFHLTQIEKSISKLQIVNKNLRDEKNILSIKIKLECDLEVNEVENEIEKLTLIKDSLSNMKKYIFNKNTINNLEKELEKNELEKENKNNKLSKNEKRVNKLREELNIDNIRRVELENNVINKLFSIQEYMITLNKSKCIVCGFEFDNHDELVNELIKIRKDIELTIGEDEKQRLSKLENIEDLENKNKMLISEINNISINEKEINKNIKQLLNENILLIYKVNDVYVNKEINDVDKELNLVEKKLNKLLKNTCLIDEYKEINKNINENNKHISNYIKNKKSLVDSFKYDNLTEKSIEDLKLELSELELKEILLNKNILTYEERINNQKKSIEEVEYKIKEYKLRYSEIEKINKYKKELKDLLIDIKNDVNCNLEMIEKVSKLDLEVINYLSFDKIMELKSELQKNNELIKNTEELLKDKKVNFEYYNNRYNAIKELIDNISDISSELMLVNIKKYNELINKFFFQISPFINSKYINIVPKEGSLFLILSEENIYEDLLEMNEEQLSDYANASLNLSSAQVNVLAVSIFLALNRSNKMNNFNFIGIDDPIQNMDDMNCYSFIDILSNLTEENQIIISTHNEQFANLLLMKSQLNDNQIEYIHYIGHDKNNVYLEGDIKVEEL